MDVSAVLVFDLEMKCFEPKYPPIRNPDVSVILNRPLELTMIGDYSVILLLEIRT